MSQFPINSPEGLYEAVNYLASGPQGTGQNFQGFSSFREAFLTGNYRKPFAQTAPAKVYVAPILCSSATQLGDKTFKYTFATPQAMPPFALGNNISGDGWTNGFYNGGQGVVGVVEVTTTYVIFQTVSAYPGTGDDFTGGYVTFSVTNPVGTTPGDELSNSTDCNARVIVTGGTDRVFIGAQVTNTISYTCSTTSDLTYKVQVNRYKGFINNDPVNPDYLFQFDDTVFEKKYVFTGLSGTGSLAEIDTIFSTIIDQPLPAYYWYILELQFIADAGDINVTECDLNLRSLSAQVVKQ
jgi:hypothetical protein